ncbi:MAG: hypothetical protein QHH13_07060 [Melioribacter sp.]|uniref:hypothetical protein n=1 Tax=Rosettibacter primus TaxID=3111523 RepID=UPI00247C6DD1|nr:hypothetical protein [Melioribacter sp.]
MNKPFEKKLPTFVLSYLGKHSSDKWSIEAEDLKNINNVVVIPAIKEYENIINLLNSISENDTIYFNETLFLFVINNPENCNQDIKEDNRKTIVFLRNLINKRSNDDFTKKIYEKGIKIGIVDASSENKALLDKEAGVGLARKIGMDLALEVFNYKSNRKKILICLDADCIVGKNYLDAIINTFNQKSYNAAYVYYEHILPENKKEKLAIICYELFLRYYVTGLKYAGSRYAYQTIGSTIVCDVESYCKAGGMNKRKAGEDFYFLEKLAKITSIHQINTTTVYPSSRISLRVPFGTGKRISKFLQGSENEYYLYHPESFNILKKWLDIFHSENLMDENYYLNQAEKIHIRLKEFLNINSFDKAMKNIFKNSKNDEQIQKQKLYWFDAFRTLKLIHYLRDTDFYMINMFDAIDKLMKMLSQEINFKRNEIIPSLEVQLEYLNYMRELNKTF